MNNGIVFWLPGNLGPCTELAELVGLISYILFLPAVNTRTLFFLVLPFSLMK